MSDDVVEVVAVGQGVIRFTGSTTREIPADIQVLSNRLVIAYPTDNDHPPLVIRNWDFVELHKVEFLPGMFPEPSEDVASCDQCGGDASQFVMKRCPSCGGK